MEAIVLGVILHFAPFTRKIDKLVPIHWIKEQNGHYAKNSIHIYC